MAGIVVKHKATGNVYAVSKENWNKGTEVFVRELKVGESVLTFPHKANVPLNNETSTPQPAAKQATTPKETK